MPKRSAAKLNVRLTFDSMPTDSQLADILNTAKSNGATIKAADLSYVTPSKVSIK